MATFPTARSIRRAALVACALSLAVPALVRTVSAQDDLRARANDLAIRNEIQKKRLDLARGLGGAAVDTKKKKSPSEGQRDFYLVLDPNDGRLELMLRNAVLRDFKLQGLEVGVPEVMFKKRHPAGEWQGQIYSAGQLDPPREADRMVVVAPPPTKEGAEVDLPVPPTPEEKYPVPSRYHIRYAESVSIEVRTTDADPQVGFMARMKDRFGRWWEDAKSALGGGSGDMVRIRLKMSPEDAKSLYRALPPETHLFVVPKS